MKKTIMLLGFLLLLSCSKGKNAPCVKELDCIDCDCIFDEMQKSVGNQARYDSLKACHEKACK